jgi:hypothetical protein
VLLDREYATWILSYWVFLVPLLASSMLMGFGWMNALHKVRDEIGKGIRGSG